MKNVPTLKLLMVERVTRKRCTNFNLFPYPSGPPSPSSVSIAVVVTLHEHK